MANQIWVMVTAMIISMVVMVLSAGPIGDFVSRNPTMKMLALSFLILIGVMLLVMASASTLIEATSTSPWASQWW